jgi:hypothetical protein
MYNIIHFGVINYILLLMNSAWVTCEYFVRVKLSWNALCLLKGSWKDIKKYQDLVWNVNFMKKYEFVSTFQARLKLVFWVMRFFL